jgi:hypothetical protein
MRHCVNYRFCKRQRSEYFMRLKWDCPLRSCHPLAVQTITQLVTPRSALRTPDNLSPAGLGGARQIKLRNLVNTTSPFENDYFSNHVKRGTRLGQEDV